MSVALAGRSMAKRNDVSVKIGPDALRWAKIVCAYRDLSVAEYLTSLVMEHAPAEAARLQAENPPPVQPSKGKPRKD
jgi:hypothetical protein